MKAISVRVAVADSSYGNQRRCSEFRAKQRQREDRSSEARGQNETPAPGGGAP